MNLQPPHPLAALITVLSRKGSTGRGERGESLTCQIDAKTSLPSPHISLPYFLCVSQFFLCLSRAQIFPISVSNHFPFPSPSHPLSHSHSLHLISSHSISSLPFPSLSLSHLISSCICSSQFACHTIVTAPAPASAPASFLSK